MLVFLSSGGKIKMLVFLSSGGNKNACVSVFRRKDKMLVFLSLGGKIKMLVFLSSGGKIKCLCFCLQEER
jgi:hypothetical protein